VADTIEREETSSINTGAPVPVAVEYVQAQLNELWRDVAEAAQAKGGGHAVTTAHALNVIVRAESEDVANDYIKDMQLITGRHPSRVIIMTADADEQDMAVQAWVSIQCQIPPAGGRQVCAEQVMVRACGEAVRQLPAAVIPLLLSDLPVFLWWPRNTPFDEYLFKSLSDSIDRLIVDSSTFENPEGTLSKMSVRLKTHWPKLACTDMNWGRITPWRELVAQFFDGPALRPYLDRIGRVTVDCALSQRGGVNRAQALLVAGWLASRLGWEPVEPTYELVRSEMGEDLPASARLSMKVGKRTITVLLNSGPWKSEHTPGEINGIKLEAFGDDRSAGPEATFSVAMSDKEDECAWIRAELKDAEPMVRHIQMDPLARAELLDAELEVFSRDKVYDEALEMVGTFIRGIDPSAKSSQDPRKMTTGEPVSAGIVRPRQHDA
jgi:glucose-6-phosphate dehydrogenase assembly protein OpcA